MVTVFNNFTSGARTKYPKIDILIWLAGLVMYKSFGYRTKLYCTEEDIGFLKDNRLYDLYDEIDTQTLATEAKEALSKVDGKRFWSTRKLECMRHEWLVLGNADSVYSDVDVVMRKPFSLEGIDALTWSPEVHKKVSIYIDWSLMTSPAGYERPEWMAKCDDAYNCGVVWFRDKEMFEEWYREYHRWADGNMCFVSPDVTDQQNNLFACNGEQRILKAVLDHRGAKVGCVMDPQGKGLCEDGSHWYWFRVIWRMAQKANAWDSTPNPEQNEAVAMLNLATLECLGALREHAPSLHAAVLGDEWLKGFEVREENGSRKLYGYLKSYD